MFGCHTKNTGKLFEVDKAAGAVIHQSECPQGQGVSVCTVSPGAQEVPQNPELLAVDAVLLKVGQAGIVVVQDRALHTPVTGKKMLLLQSKDTTLGFRTQQVSLRERCEELTM